PEWHIRMQGGFQEFTDSAISKTCNFSESATEADVREIYELAYQLNCKGVTVYRDNSRPMQVLSTGATAKKVEEKGADQKSDVRSDARSGARPATELERELAELKGQLAEERAEMERVKRDLHTAEAEN